MNTRKTADCVSRYLDESLSGAEEQALVEQLRADPAARELLYDLAMQHAMLQRLTRTAGFLPAGLDLEVPARGARRVPDRDAGRKVLPLPRRARSWRITALAAALLVAMGIGLHVQMRRLRDQFGAAPRAAALSAAAVDGDIALEQAGRRSRLAPGMVLALPCRIVSAGPHADAAFVYRDGTRLRLQGETVLQFRDVPDTGAKSVFVETGMLEADVAPQPAGRAMLIESRDAEVHVIGTRLTVSVSADATHVDVAEGEVRVSCKRTGQSVALSAGHSAVVAAGIAVQATPGHTPDRTVAGTPRVRLGLLALYRFDAGRGVVVRDVSGIGRALDLRIAAPEAVRWLPGGGLAVTGRTLIASGLPATKITQGCRATGELTVEAWIAPLNTTQSGPGRIVTLSENPGRDGQNFTLAQAATFYYGRLRTGAGTRGVCAGIDVVRTALSHVVFTRDAKGLCRIYVDGVQRKLCYEPELQPEPSDCLYPQLPIDGPLSVWNPGFQLVLADEVRYTGHSRFWLGAYHLVALYNRALSHDEVQANYTAGVGGRRLASRTGTLE
ncbi:MAG: FecR domain-containing protein [Kiritimatiellae bacterium]|nr:FecR domain-containing protein [Kiritimatiellia bacterium]